MTRAEWTELLGSIVLMVLLAACLYAAVLFLPAMTDGAR